MSDLSVSTPVAFIIFNRPDTTEQVFEIIRQVKPPLLLVIGDGPRLEYPEDAEKCAAARAVVERVDWDCNVLTNFAQNNMGCKHRVSSGLDWVFEMVEAAIVLEDDCLPHPTFFRFCEELLERYRDDERIMAISGDNFQFGRQRSKYSYYFSRYPHCWGWATWRRAWQHYDGDMDLWPVIREGRWLEDVLEGKRAVAYWTRIFNRTYDGDINSWAYAWTLSCWAQSGLTALPNVNLVSNIGFGVAATHTISEDISSSSTLNYLDFPLSHPSFVIQDTVADAFTQRHHFDRAPLKSRFKRIVKSLFGVP